MADAYARIDGVRLRFHGQPAGFAPLLFVDLDARYADDVRAPLLELRRLPFHLLRQRDTFVLLRGIGDFSAVLTSGPVPRRAAQRRRSVLGLGRRSDPVGQVQIRHLREVLDELGFFGPCAVLEQRLGEAPAVHGDGDASDLIPRARAAEVRAMLHWGAAISIPDDHHYILPSGEHAEGFVRLADAIREPRDADVMASWLAPALRDGVGVMLDTGTLTSIVEAAASAMHRTGQRLGDVRVLESYPRTRAEVAVAVQRASRAGAGLVALLSVNSTGAMKQDVLDALSLQNVGGEVHVAVDNRPAPDDPGTVTTWYPLPDDDPIIRGTSGAGACDLCASTTKSPLLSIDPVTYSPQWPGAVQRIYPAIGRATENRRLWEVCSAHDSIGLQRARNPGLVPLGSGELNLLGVKISIPPLLGDERFRDGLRAGLLHGLERLRGQEGDRSFVLEPDVVLVPDHELDAHGDALHDVLLELSPDIIHRLDRSRLVPFPAAGGELSEQVKLEVENSGQALIVATGTVTGTGLQHALVSAQAHAPGGAAPPFRVFGLVLHARPGDGRSWRSLRNSFGERLIWGWLTPLPWASPLSEERRTLTQFTEAENLSVVARRFFEERLEFCSLRSESRPSGLFWGAREGQMISPQSIFGEDLKAPAAYAAVASAMEFARIDAREGTLRRVFHLPAILRSYYDPLLIAAMLRWMRPHERWWGQDPANGYLVVDQLRARTADGAGRRILAAELLLAASQGKLTPSAARAAWEIAQSELAGNLPDLERGPLELALALVDEPPALSAV